MGLSLKPCPFCGGEAIRCQNHEGRLPEAMIWVMCKACHASPGDFPTEDRAFAAWNARTEDRVCTCHPSEAPAPCAKRYALSECLAEATEAQAQELETAKANVTESHHIALMLTTENEAQARRIGELEAGLRDAIEDLLSHGNARWSEYEGTEEDLVGEYLALLPHDTKEGEGA